MSKKLTKKEIQIINSSDDNNPKYLFQGINTSLLSLAALEKLDLNRLVEMELANRGLDRSGKWIGFDAAKKLYSL